MMKHNRKLHKPRTDHRETGVALLLVLLFVALLAVIISAYVYDMRVEAAFVQNHVDTLGARVAAKSAIAMGMGVLQQDLIDSAESGLEPFDAFTDIWAEGVPVTSINSGVMRCSIADEFGKLNLNALIISPEGETNEVLEYALRILFADRGVEEDPVDAILDWLDPYDDARPNGASSEFYESLDTPYSSKNGPMDSIEELLMIRGITPELYFGDPELGQVPLTELLTVHGHRRGRINANTAHPELLVAIADALGQPGLADVIVQSREELPFENEDDLRARGVIDPRGDDSTGQGSNLFITQTRVFRLRGDGMVHGAKVRIEVFARRQPGSGGGSFRILDWRELL